MSPEQASGKRVDKRSDIWSFGVVLWEILTGKPLFGEDETISHTLADVLRAEIDFTKLPASVAEPIRLLLRRCLTRDVRKRLRDIGEARIILENPESQRQISPRAESRPTRVSLLWPIAALLLLSMLAAVSFVHFREQPPTADVIRFQIPAPEKASLVAVPPIISPDGHKVVFLASDEGGRSRLWVRSVDALDARPLNVTEAGTSNSFWSPDSRFVAFAQENKLKRGSERGYA
jgi:serine/threonine-protein kinase